MSIILCSSDIICTVVLTGPYRGGVKTGELVHTSQTKMGLVKVEGKFYNRTTTPEKTEIEALCIHTTCVHAPHTHI